MNTIPASLRSSVSSIYRNYDFHFDVLKLTGVVVLLSVMAATLGLVSNIRPCQYETDCKRLEATEVPMNNSLCTYAKQFDLPNDYVVTVCTYQERVRIDVRKFVGNQPTILGYFLQTNEWNQLKRLTPSIDEAILEASHS